MQNITSEFTEYAKKFTTPESDRLKRLRRRTEAELAYSGMLSGRVVGRFLQMLIKISGAKNLLEIGTFTGYGTLSMAEALPEDGNIITIDINEKYIKIAEAFFRESNAGSKIKVMKGYAADLLPQLTGSFDLVFLDADKGNYPRYYDLVIPKIREGGILVIDNAFWGGEVLQPEDPKSAAIHRVNEKAFEDKRVETLYLTVRDGLNVIRKIV